VRVDDEQHPAQREQRETDREETHAG
jgi:hypothetical protein